MQVSHDLSSPPLLIIIVNSDSSYVNLSCVTLQARVCVCAQTSWHLCTSHITPRLESEEENLVRLNGGCIYFMFIITFELQLSSFCQSDFFAETFDRQRSVRIPESRDRPAVAMDTHCWHHKKLRRLVEDIINNKGLEAKVAWGSVWKTSSHSYYNWHRGCLCARECMCA